ncbi:MAG: molybdopterin-dependent oxidoreductase, partial [Spirochaetota bacterium]|nr:molybdopterin-dependent oxidoreductase [Spirochaetota bacterium]
QKVEDENISLKFSESWGKELSKKNGLTIMEMFKGIEDSSIKALYIMGENPMVSDPDLDHVKNVLENADFLVVQDIFMTETAQLAHVVLPTYSFAEKDGTFTNTERRVQRVRKAVEAPGEAKEDWKIFTEIASKMGYDLNYSSAEEIFNEIATITPSYAGINYKRIDEEGGLQWPCPNTGHKGTKFLHENQFSRGKGLFHSIEYQPSAELPDDEYPYILSTGRILQHFHTGSMTRRSEGLNQIAPECIVEINPADAIKSNINDSDKIKIISRRGEIETKVKITPKSPEGVLFIPFHYAEAAANKLTNTALDPVAKIPEYKVCAVRLER